MTKCFCVTKLLTDKIFSPSKQNQDKLKAKVPGGAASQSHAYISEKVTNNKYEFYITPYQKQT